jgi:hypothetical protein
LREPGRYFSNLRLAWPRALAELTLNRRLLRPWIPALGDSTWQIAGAVVFLVLLVFVLLRSGALRRHAPTLGYLVVGAAIGMVPSFAVKTRDWAMLAPAFGVSGVIALALHEAARSLRLGIARSWSLLVPGAVLALVHIVGPAVEAPRKGIELAGQVNRFIKHAEIASSARRLAIFKPGEDVLRSCVVEIRPELRIDAAWTLCDAPKGCAWLRTDDKTLIVTSLGGSMLSAGNAWRTKQFPLAEGQTIALDGLQVRVTKTKGADVLQAEFRFEQGIDDPALQFLANQKDTLKPLPRPRLGEKLDIL